jgi:hypothetical protein
MMKSKLIKLGLLLFALSTAGCGEPPNNTRGVFMLLDTSGTYTLELDKASTIISYILTQLEPTETFAVGRIDSGSFSEKDVIAKVTFDERQTAANTQKRKFRQDIDNFLKNLKSSPYTDITGGILQAVETLNESGAGRKMILIFSDMKQELPKGYKRDFPLELSGFEVICLNVTKLRSDIKDPLEYMNRMEQWQKKVEEGGGTFRVINDLERLDAIFHP